MQGWERWLTSEWAITEGKQPIYGTLALKVIEREREREKNRDQKQGIKWRLENKEEEEQGIRHRSNFILIIFLEREREYLRRKGNEGRFLAWESNEDEKVNKRKRESAEAENNKATVEDSPFSLSLSESEDAKYFVLSSSVKIYYKSLFFRVNTCEMYFFLFFF